jgi:uncharacterized protein (TIGR02145 family)
MEIHKADKTVVVYKLSEVDSVTFTPCFKCGENLNDFREGKSYKTVQIGTQCWMKENLNVGIFAQSNNTGISHSDVLDNGVIEKYCYNNDVNNCNAYGGLYDWNEMMNYTTTEGTQGICPLGWHIPTDGEWTILVDFLGGENVAGGKMKEEGYTHWQSPNTGATDSIRFTALPGGSRYEDGTFRNIKLRSRFWTITPDGSENARNLTMDNDNKNAILYSDIHSDGFSIRCIKN